MLESDRIILLVVKKNRKVKDYKRIVRQIKKILADSENFDYNDMEKFYTIKSTTEDKKYKVYKSDINGVFYCDCIFNYMYKPYRIEKHLKNNTQCIHILALKVWLIIHKDLNIDMVS